jgi:MEKHLA domain
MTLPVWTHPAIIEWTQWILNSYRHWTGRELLERVSEPDVQAKALFQAPFVVVSHGREDDPILNYGNQKALDLWEMTWDRLVQTPSRLTAEPADRAEREWILEQAQKRGYFDTYRGIRISSTGRRFLVEDALIWNVMDPRGLWVGQAASFSRWSWLT